MESSNKNASINLPTTSGNTISSIQPQSMISLSGLISNGISSMLQQQQQQQSLNNPLASSSSLSSQFNSLSGLAGLATSQSSTINISGTPITTSTTPAPTTITPTTTTTPSNIFTSNFQSTANTTSVNGIINPTIPNFYNGVTVNGVPNSILPYNPSLGSLANLGNIAGNIINGTSGAQLVYNGEKKARGRPRKNPPAVPKSQDLPKRGRGRPLKVDENGNPLLKMVLASPIKKRGRPKKQLDDENNNMNNNNNNNNNNMNNNMNNNNNNLHLGQNDPKKRGNLNSNGMNDNSNNNINNAKVSPSQNFKHNSNDSSQSIIDPQSVTLNLALFGQNQ